MKTKIWLSIALVMAALAALPLSAQNFPPVNGNDGPVASFGAFWILVDPPYQPLFAGCPATVYNPATHILQSGPLYDNVTTVMGHSKSIKEGSPDDNGGVAVGVLPPTTVKDAGMVTPSSFTPIAPGSNEVHTVIRHLNLTTYPAVPFPNQARVRAGECYNSTSCTPVSPPPPNRVSRGEVVSNHAPAGTPPDFPARSYFNVFAQIDIPACGGFPGATVVECDFETWPSPASPCRNTQYRRFPAVRCCLYARLQQRRWNQIHETCAMAEGQGQAPGLRHPGRPWNHSDLQKCSHVRERSTISTASGVPEGKGGARTIWGAKATGKAVEGGG